jgi:hypothetical protein
MMITAEHVFEPIRQFYGLPLSVTSFYRSPALNKAVGGSRYSQHMKGEAIDIKGFGSPQNLKNSYIFKYAYRNLVFDQLIWEFGDTTDPAWVHISYSAKGNRQQALRAVIQGGKKHYLPYK